MTNELIKVQTNQEGEQRVSARELYKALAVSSNTRFSRWFETNSTMFVDGLDFTSVLTSTVVNNGATRQLEDFLMTVEMAKHMALLSRLWTGFFDTARCRYTEKFSKPRFQPKMA